MEQTRPVLAALAFLTVGISLKLALFPLHQWLPERLRLRAVGGVGVPRGHGDQGVGVRAAALLLLRVRRQRSCSARCRWRDILLVLSLAAMFVASAVAIFQADLKRMFAYSSVAQIGYITFGISFDIARPG